MPEACSSLSRASGEAPYGTASRARRWVLLEQPGPWGADALRESDLPPAVADHLERLAAELPARVLLLRRQAGQRPPGTERILLAGVSDLDGGWLEEIELDSVHDLLDVDLGGIATGTTVGGTRVVEPVYLVCTNGKHDACCASRGLPVARALADQLGERLWECSHVGGDRFAGNLVCLPDGTFYGHLDPESAVRAVAAHEGGRLLLEHWRGRSCLSFPVQAAEALVRRELGLERQAALRVTGVQAAGDRHEVRFALLDDQVATATVRRGRAPARSLTCGAAAVPAPTFELVELRTSATPMST